MTTDLTVQSTQLPATRTGGKGLFNRVAKGNNLLPRLKLFSSGKWINKRLVKPGQYGVIVGDDEVTVYGDTIDMFVFAARAKALDRTNPKSTVVKPAESVFGETVLDDRFYPVTKQLSQRLSAFGSFQFEIGFVTMKARTAKLEDEHVLRLAVSHLAVLGIVE